MGQYHTIYNITKKEYFSIGGAKLLEKSSNVLCSTALMVLLCNSNGRGGGDVYIQREYTKDYKPKPLKGVKASIQSDLEAIQGRWAGDKIVMQGDYAKEDDPAFLTEEQLKDFQPITKQVLSAMRACDELARMVESKSRYL